VSPNGVDEIRAAYDREQRQARKKFESKLVTLSQLPFAQWNNGILYKELHGPAKGLGEIRFKADGVQQRPLGFRSGEYEFTLLFWAHEKGNKWVPLDACERALARIDSLNTGVGRTHALWFALE
jgi:hypothetical protein